MHRKTEGMSMDDSVCYSLLEGVEEVFDLDEGES